MSEIYIGADLKNASVTLTIEDTVLDWDLYDAVQLNVVDRYQRVIAQYKYPTTADYHELDLQEGGIAVFDLFKDETALMPVGDIYANVTLTQTDADYPDGYMPEIRSIYLGKATRR